MKNGDQWLLEWFAAGVECIGIEFPPHLGSVFKFLNWIWKKKLGENRVGKHVTESLSAFGGKSL